MDKFRMHQILSVLLLPYREEDFENPEKDIIANLRKAYARIKDTREDSLYERKQLLRKYDKAEKDIIQYIKLHPEMKFSNLDDFKMIVDLFFKEEEISYIYQKCWREKRSCQYIVDKFYLENLYNIAVSLITFRDGRAAIRTWRNAPCRGKEDIFDYPNVFDKVEIWNLLCRMIVPDVIIAAFYVESGLRDVSYLYNQQGTIFLADKTLEKILNKGVAETHCHFNAGLEYIYLWQQYMDLRLWDNVLVSEHIYVHFCKTNKIGIEVPIYRAIWSEYLESDGAEELEQFICEKYPDDGKDILAILRSLMKGDKVKYSKKLVKINKNIISHFERKSRQVGERDFLLASIYSKYRKYRTNSEMIILLKSMWLFKDMQAKRYGGVAHLFLQYIRRKNIFYKKVMQDNQIQGLANFRLYFGEMRNRMKIMNSPEACELIFRSFSANLHLRKLEIRITPNMQLIEGNIPKRYFEYSTLKYEIKCELLKSIQAVLAAYQKNLREMAGIYEWQSGQKMDFSWLDLQCREGRIVVPTIGIIFHFTKKNYVDNRAGDMCWVRDAENQNYFTRHIIIWRRTMAAYAKAIEELRSTMPLLGKYVVGIDAASEENQAEPWIFAPVYNAIRNKRITKPVIEGNDGRIERVNNIGFTYHVGEEFRHLLSGLRHIDEVIEHFHYKPGDRLGHAIALGVDVKYWMERNTVVIIPVMEHLENLLWLWGNMVYDNWIIEIAVEALEGKILNLAKMIYDDVAGMSVHTLYDAYIEKFNLNYEDTFAKIKEKFILKNPADVNAGTDVQHFCRYYDPQSPYGYMWTKEKIFCTFFCPFYFRKSQKPIFINVDKEEYRMLKKVQEYVVRKVELKGIYVEINPSSNATIGEIKSLYASHILNLNSKGLSESPEEKHEVLVTVNSDDPLIFNTNCENELAYIYHSLVYKNYKKESILQWIDKVRQMGIDSSFVKKEVLPSIQYKELGEILEEIREFLVLKK